VRDVEETLSRRGSDSLYGGNRDNGTGHLILAEAALSYLGLGTQPPYASRGRMLNEAPTFMEISPWLAIFPGLAIAWAVLGFNLLGDGLRDLLDPKLSRTRR
jgi:peptide/nickel transport system permease protein